MRKEITLDRNELYEKAWQTPIMKLAGQYGISDRGLAKICKKLNIPVPPRGYWATVKSGIKLKRPKLPKIRKGAPETHTVYTDFQAARSSNNLKGLGNKAIETITLIQESPPLKIDSPPADPHPLTLTTQKNLERQQPKDYPLISPNKQGQLNIRVAPVNLARALAIMDPLLKWFEENGFRIKKDSEKLSGIYALIFGEKIFFSIDEKTRRIDYIPTKTEKEEQKKYFWRTYSRYDYLSTGTLNLRIDVSSWASGFQKKWSDGKTKSIEDKLNAFLIGAIKIADRIGKERVEREEKQKRWEEECRLREEKRIQQRIEKERQQELENQAFLWKRSEKIRAYIRAVEETTSDRTDNKTMNKFIEWRNWATQCADQIDPIKNGLPFEE